MDADIHFSCSATNTDGSKWRAVLRDNGGVRDGDAGFQDLAMAAVGVGARPPIITITELGAIRGFDALRTLTDYVGVQAPLRGDADRSVILWDAARFDAHVACGVVHTQLSANGGYFSVVLHDKIYHSNLLVCNVHMPKIRGALKGRELLACYLEEATADVDATVILGDFNATNATLHAHDDLGPLLTHYTPSFKGAEIENVYASELLHLPASVRSPSRFTHQQVSATVEGDAGPYALRGVQGDLFD